MKNLPKLTSKKIYSDFSVFVFSTFSILLMFLVLQFQSKYSFYLAQGFFIVSFFGYSYVIASILEFYLIKTFISFRKNYPEYKWWYWGVIGFLVLIVLVILAYFKLDKNTFWETIFGAGLTGTFSLTVLASNKIIHKYSKNE